MFSMSILNSARIGSRNVSFVIEAESGILVFDEISKHLQLFNPRDNKWKQMQKMTADMKQDNFSAIVCGGNLYVLMRNKSVCRLGYSEERATWERMADMMDAHGWASRAIVWEGCIYVFWGHQGTSRKGIEKYDPAMNEWSRLPDKLQPFRGSTVLTGGNYIYLFRGIVVEESSNLAEKFDPMSVLWSEVTRMEKTRGYAAAVGKDGRIYIVGGIHSSRSLDRYDINNDEWDRLTCMKTARYDPRAFAIDGCIFAVVGRDKASCSIEKYNMEEWDELQLPSGLRLNILESVEIKLPQ